jgi:hypothetical protein
VGKKMIPHNITLIRTDHMGSVVDEVALGPVSQVLCFSPANIFPPKLFTHLSSGACITRSFEGRSTMGLSLTPPQKINNNTLR